MTSRARVELGWSVLVDNKIRFGSHPSRPLGACGDPVTNRRFRKAYLAGEYVLLFFGLASIYAVLFRGTSPIPFLLVLGLAVVVYLLRSSGFDRASLWRPGTLWSQARSIAALWCLAAVCLSATVAFLRPGLLFAFPREDPLIWALVMVLYPLLSVYPQELIFRGSCSTGMQRFSARVLEWSLRAPWHSALYTLRSAAGYRSR